MILFQAVLCLLGVALAAAEGVWDFELYTVASPKPKKIRLREVRTGPGVKLVALDIFSVHCDPCRRAIPEWTALYETYRDAGLRVIVVALGCSDHTASEEKTLLSHFFTGSQVPFPVVFAPSPAFAAEKFRLIAGPDGKPPVPQSLLVDREGLVRIREVGHSGVFEEVRRSLQ